MGGRITANHLAEMPVRWEDLIITFVYDIINSRVEVVMVTIQREDGGPVPVASRPPLARLAAQALRELRIRWAPQILRNRPSVAAVAAVTALLDAPGPRRGRPPLYSHEHWVEVAQVYASDGTGAVADRWSISYSTAWRWIKQAKAKQL
jgi:hypothetical protein